jgi:hypothetical protein
MNRCRGFWAFKTWLPKTVHDPAAVMVSWQAQVEVVEGNLKIHDRFEAFEALSTTSVCMHRSREKESSQDTFEPVIRNPTTGRLSLRPYQVMTWNDHHFCPKLKERCKQENARVMWTIWQGFLHDFTSSTQKRRDLDLTRFSHINGVIWIVSTTLRDTKRTGPT